MLLLLLFAWREVTEGDVVLMFARGGADQSHSTGSRVGFTHRLEVMAFAATWFRAWSLLTLKSRHLKSYLLSGPAYRTPSYVSVQVTPLPLLSSLKVC